MDKLLKKVEKTKDLKELQVLSILITDQVYDQWKEEE